MRLYGAPTPDAKTIRLFREKLTAAGMLDPLFADFDDQLKERGYLAMGGQIVDATLMAAPNKRNTQRRMQSREATRRHRSGPTNQPARPRRTRTRAGR